MTETNSESSNFLTKAVAVGATLAVGGTIVAAAGQEINRNNQAAALEALSDEKAQAKAEYVLSAQEMASGMFSIDDVVDSFKVTSGGLEDPSLAVIEKSLGTELFNDSKPLFYNALRASIDLHGTVHPDETYYVVMGDLDPEADNGKEYFVVNPDQINHGVVDSIPSPETH